MALNAQGNVMVTGYTLSTDFPVTPDAAQPKSAGNGDAFVAVVNPISAAAFLVYSTYLGGKDGDVAYGITTDSAGSLYVTGYTLSSDFPVTGDAPQIQWGGGVDIFVAKIKPGVAGPGAIQFGTFMGGQNIYAGNNIAVGADGTMYVAGYGSFGLPSSANASQYGYAGGPSDGFLIVMPQTTGAPQATGAAVSEWFNAERIRRAR